MLGTPAFMPPEQAGGEVDKIDERSDVFGLGAILCVILTGKPPYSGKDSDTVRLMAIRGELADGLARLDASGAEPELVDLCKRCLAVQPTDRPKDAGEVAQAIAQFRAEAEERAKRAEIDRARAEVAAAEQRKRRKVQAALGLAFTSLVVLSGVFAWWQEHQAAERKAEHTRVQGERAAERAAAEGRAQQAVESAVALAADLRDKFRFAEAAGTLDQAEALVPPDSPRIREQLASARKDLAFVRQLDEIRISRVRSDFWTGRDALLGLYATAFRDIGIDPTEPDSATVGERIAVSPIKSHLVIALDDWSWNESDYITRERLLAVVRRADPGPWSDRLRDSTVRSRPAALDQLAAEVDPDAIPANLVVLLFQLRSGRWTSAPKLLATAVNRYPIDFWVQFEAGYYYYVKYPLPAVAACYFRAAHTLRPDLPLVKKLLMESMVPRGADRSGHHRDARDDPTRPENRLAPLRARDGIAGQRPEGGNRGVQGSSPA